MRRDVVMSKMTRKYRKEKCLMCPTTLIGTFTGKAICSVCRVGLKKKKEVDY